MNAATASFADIVVAFSDFLLCMDNASETDFYRAKEFCLKALKTQNYKEHHVIGGIEE